MRNIVLFTTLMAMSAMAFSEDIELYISDAIKQASGKKNVLIILDNSASMTKVEEVKEGYLPGTTYDPIGPDHSLDERFVYFTKGGVDNTGLPVPDQNKDSRRFLTDINSCETARVILETVGFYTGQIREYAVKGKTGTWSEIPDNNGANIEVIDCEDDVLNNDDTNIAALPAGFPINGALDASKNPLPHTPDKADSNVNWTGQLVTLYTDNYLRWYHNEAIAKTLKTRMDIAKESISAVISSTPSINFGLQVYNYDGGDAVTDANGGRIVFGIKEMTDVNKANLLDIINNQLSAETWTPLCETLYEASQYFAGNAVDFGDDDMNQGSSYTANKPPRDLAVESSKVYKTPFGQCNSTAFVILITDGEPTFDQAADSKIAALKDFTGAAYDGSYLPALAEWMHTKDVNTTLAGDQFVDTYTIGFSEGADDAAPLLTETAKLGGGSYAKAVGNTQLISVFNDFFNKLPSTNSSLTSASVAANNFDRTQTLNSVYYAMFDPQNSPRWQGNLKKYKVVNDKQEGQEGVDALDPDTDGFSADVTSFWSTSKDGNKVAEGGVADMLRNLTTRTVYSDIGTAGSLELKELTSTEAETPFGDKASLATYLGVTEDEVTDTINWAKGLDVDDEDNDESVTDMRYDVFGDPLHSKPLVVNYGGDIGIKLVIGTNAGALHMFEDKGDTAVTETWAFMPKEFFPDIKTLRENSPGENKIYGIDGRISSFVYDKKGDDKINSVDGDKVWIFFGLRRGGSSYYALDISNPNIKPTLMWHIDSSSSGFGELGQSWSQPKVGYSKLNIVDGVAKPVLFIGGGYDTNKDAAGPGTSDGKGRAIYMLDAATGAIKWSIAPSGGTTTFSGITDSIPSSIALLDSDGDGLTDRLYTGDTGGNVWRIDMPGAEPNSATSPWTAFKLASLGGTTNATDNRFFNEPSIVRTFITETIETEITDEDGVTTKIVSHQEKPYDAVLLGSGDRSNPLGKDTLDAFYMIKDEHIHTQSFSASTTPAAPTAKLKTDLYNYTDSPFGKTYDADPAKQAKALEDLAINVSKKSGWYIDFGATIGTLDGEKNSSSAIVINGVAYFTSYIPPSLVVDPDSCNVPTGTGWLYAVDLALGTKVYNWKAEDAKNRDDRIAYISEQFLGSPTLIVLPEDDDDPDTIDKTKGNIIVGRKIIDVGFNLNTLRTHLYETESQ